MKCFIACVVLLALSAPVSAADTRWTTHDTALQVLTTALLEVDRQQTNWASDHYVRDASGVQHVVNEANPILGNQASEGQINTYFATVAAGHAAISYALRKSGWELFGVPAVSLWQSLAIGLETSVIANNYRLGIRMEF